MELKNTNVITTFLVYAGDNGAILHLIIYFISQGMPEWTRTGKHRNERNRR